MFTVPGAETARSTPRLSGKPVFGLISLYVVENNGVRFLSSILREQGYEVVEIYLKDYYHARFVWPTEAEVLHVLKILKERGVTLVGISLRAGGYYKVCKAISKRIQDDLGLPVMWGGMHVTMAPEQCIPHADLIVVGEAERVIVELFDKITRGEDIAEVPSVWLHRDGQVIRNPVRMLEEDLDSLPFRDFHSHHDKYWVEDDKIIPGDPYATQTSYLMLSARGCLFNCSFCDINALRKVYRGKGKFYRAMSPEKVVEEAKYAVKAFKNLRRIRFDDELFMLEEEWVDRFCEIYPKEVGIPFEFLTDPRVVNEDLLRKLKKAGMATVMMGIQNLDTINKAIFNRNVSNEKVLEAAHAIKRIGVRPCYQILMDDPISTPQDKRDFFEFLCELPRPYDLYLFSLSYWPSCDVTDNFLKQGLITPADVEGENDKCLKQFRVDLSWPRPKEDVFWLSIITLLSKDFLPIPFIRWLSHRKWLMEHPWPVYAAAQFLNAAKLGLLALELIRRRELTWDTLKRWVNWKSLATS
ncbi:MAG: B12-binding domain-containing radical SAM protein [Armatimonadetes bacterium]|nr:B12-binding domain-containing radical SAM protein [Armatimonadota bacterium]